MAIGLLFSAGMASAGCELAMGGVAAKAQSSDTWRTTYASSEVRRLRIKNVNGSIELSRSSGTMIEIVAEKQVRADTDEAARTLLDRVTIDESRQGEAAVIQTRMPKFSGIFNRGSAEVRYTVALPDGVSVDLETVNGPIRADAVSGRFEATTVNGSIDARAISGAVDVSTVNGKVELELDRVDRDGVSLQTVNGGIDLVLPQDAPASVTASCVNGSIKTDGLPLTVEGARRHNLRGDLNGGGATVSLSTVNGSVRLTGSGATTAR